MEIDVSKCVFKGEQDTCRIYSGTCGFSDLCSSNETCQIKILLTKNEAVKQAEKLKEYLKIDEIVTLEDGDIVFTSEVLDEFIFENRKLKAENEELKKQLQEESDLGHQAIQEEADSFFETLKYKRCLDYIKDVVENHIMQDASEWLTLSPDVVEDYVLANCKQILDKIKEVKEMSRTMD